MRRLKKPKDNLILEDVMANLTNTQKKNRNKFVALMVAIVVVLAAIAVVVYNGLTVASFANAEFEAATAQALAKKAGSVPKSALEEVKYVEFSNSGTQMSVFFGYDDFLTQLDAYNAEQEVIYAAQEESSTKLAEMKEAAKAEAEAAGETFDEEAFDSEEHDTGVVIPEATIKHPVEIAKSGASASAGTRVEMGDIKYFTGAEIISITGAKVDAKVLSGLNAKEYNFVACDFTNFKAMANLDYSKIEKLTLDMACAGVDEATLEALSANGDKVYLAQYYDFGGGMYYPAGEMSLTEYFAALEEAEKEAAEEESTEEVVEENAEVVVEEETAPETAEVTE